MTLNNQTSVKENQENKANYHPVQIFTKKNKPMIKFKDFQTVMNKLIKPKPQHSFQNGWEK